MPDMKVKLDWAMLLTLLDAHSPMPYTLCADGRVKFKLNNHWVIIKNDGKWELERTHGSEEPQ